jgi:hypothetical protein
MPPPNLGKAYLPSPNLGKRMQSNYYPFLRKEGKKDEDKLSKIARELGGSSQSLLEPNQL